MTGEQIHPITLADSWEVIHLTAEESLRMAEVLLAPPREPNAHQLAALKRYRQIIQQQDDDG